MKVTEKFAALKVALLTKLICESLTLHMPVMLKPPPDGCSPDIKFSDRCESKTLVLPRRIVPFQFTKRISGNVAVSNTEL